MKFNSRSTLFLLLVTLIVCSFLISGCRRSSGGGGSDVDILGSSDETTEAGQLILEANADLKKIRVLYEQNEGKREELKKAMEANETEKVRKIADDVVYLINDGASSANSAIEKIEKAQEMQINDDYREYLRLKEDALKKQMQAFEEYRQAARTLRDNYDPKNAQQRDKVKEEFKSRSENYQKIMEQARDYSSRANELAKEALKKQSS